MSGAMGMRMSETSWKLCPLLFAIIAIMADTTDGRQQQQQLETEFLNLQLNTSTIVMVKNNSSKSRCTVKLNVQHEDVLRVVPNRLKIDPGDGGNFTLFATNAGKSDVTSEPSAISFCDVFLSVSVYKEYYLIIISSIVGWLYFACWSVNMFPQVWFSYKRKRVVGLNFDFLTLTMIGHVYYFTFNVCLYFVPIIREQYSQRFPRSPLPVLINDMVYPTTGAIATCINIVQCFIYERGDQRVSMVVKFLCLLCALMTASFTVLCATDMMDWLDFAYFCSYVKLAVTFKYIPQMYMNYKRSSTDGFSVGYAILDIGGGILSVLQMCVDAYNYDDWGVFLENATKFFVGLLTIFFDLLLIFQHFVIYNPKCEKYKQKVKETTVFCTKISNNSNAIQNNNNIVSA